MRTHPRRSRSTLGATLPILAALCLASGVGGCGNDEDQQARDAAPPLDTPRSAPTQNPLTSGSTPAAPAPVPASEALPSPAEALDSGTRIESDGLSFVVPEQWEREAVTSSMRAAQYLVPSPDADGAPGTFVVFRGIGGSPEENIQRWIGQLTEKTEAPERASVDLGNGLTVHTVRMTGTYTVGTMMGGSGNPEPDTMFLGAVITGGPGPFPVFLRLTGPRTTVEPHVAAWNAVLASAQTAGPAQ